MQNHLEGFCLHCLFGLMEITEDRLLILKEVSLEPFIYSFLNSSDIHVIEAAGICLGGYEI